MNVWHNVADDMVDVSEPLTARLLRMARVMAADADYHPLRLVEVSQALFVDQIVRPLATLDAARDRPGLDDMTAALEATMPGAAPKGGRWYREQAAAILARLAEAQQREGAGE